MKIPFSDYMKVKKMTFNEFNVWIKALCQDLLEEGIRQGESELDDATAEQWREYIDATPKAKEIFSIWDGDDLRAKLSKHFSRDNVDRIMDIIGGDDEQ